MEYAAPGRDLLYHIQSHLSEFVWSQPIQSPPRGVIIPEAVEIVNAAFLKAARRENVDGGEAGGHKLDRLMRLVNVA